MKALFLLLVCLSATVLATESNDDNGCNAFKDPGSCSSASVNGTKCVWCVCHAVPSSCYSEDQAHKLPPSIFKCAFTHSRLESPPSDVCTGLTNPSECSSKSECTWCVNTQNVNGVNGNNVNNINHIARCLLIEKAKSLPPSSFRCTAILPHVPIEIQPTRSDEMSPVELNVNDCHTITDPDKCDSSSQPDSKCVWCSSKAVPSSCLMETQARHLPPSIFNCHLPPSPPLPSPPSPPSPLSSPSPLPSAPLNNLKDLPNLFLHDFIRQADFENQNKNNKKNNAPTFAVM